MESLYSILVRLTFATCDVPVLKNDGLHTICNQHRVFICTSVPFKVNVTASFVRFFFFFSIECLPVQAIAKATCCTISCACWPMSINLFLVEVRTGLTLKACPRSLLSWVHPSIAFAFILFCFLRHLTVACCTPRKQTNLTHEFCLTLEYSDLLRV